MVAIDAPELYDREVWFEVRSDGYELPADGFGFRGRRIQVTPGRSLQVKLKRTSIAARVGRLTGSGLFAESKKLGLHLNEHESKIVGCDSVHVTPWKGSYFWLWGDTTLHDYPLGFFKHSVPYRPIKNFSLRIRRSLPNSITLSTRIIDRMASLP